MIYPPASPVQVQETSSRFHVRFEQVAQASPEATAILFGDTVWTYAQLDQEANRIASRLEETPTPTEQSPFLGIYLQKSPLLIATVLGCMKAGRPFLLLDPEYSSERLAFMRQDARVRTILTQETLLAHLPEQEGVSFVCVEQESSCGHRVPLLQRAATTDILCAIYTSGTSGQIKAAYIEHKVLDLLYLEQVRLYNLTSSDRIVQFASQGYDAFLWEMIALLAGAVLCLGMKRELEAGPVLSHFLKSRRVTIASLTPSVLASLPEEELPDLRVIITIGEYCPRSLVQRFAPGRHFHNAYGLMEGGICQTSGECLATDSHDPSIGFPLRHVTLRILGEDLQPVPDGHFGEIAVGGPAVSARGYFQRPELTAKVFIPDPCDSSRLLCRTGDRGRINPDGSITLSGRLQHNDVFKVNGVRVERQEIEEAILRHPLLEGAACRVVQQHYDGASRLLAFLVLSEAKRFPTRIVPAELRAYLLTKTPLRVVPDAFIALSQFPLGPNGKLDEAALQNWTFPEEEEGEQFTPPETEVERELAERFARILHLKRISTTAFYMRLRNSSVSIAFFASQIYEAFGVSLSLIEITQKPTIRELASALQAKLRSPELETA